MSLKTGAIACVMAVLSLGGAVSASAAVTPTDDAEALAEAIVAGGDSAAVTGAALTVTPPNGAPSATADSEYALFPLAGGTYSLLGTGDTSLIGEPNASGSTSVGNGGDGGGHGAVANDLITLRIDLQVPQNRNCLTLDYRFLTEEFPEFVGSQYNDAFLAELDNSDFTVAGSGVVTAPSNFAFGPNGNVTTVNAAGTSADNALGTTYDGGTPVLRATTPVTPGAHTVHLSIYDASDHIYDSTVLLDNLRLRSVTGNDCKRGAAPNAEENGKCQGKSATVIASGGVATGTKGPDVILGSKADDIIRGRGGDDLICGRAGDDTIRGHAGADSIRGDAGDDVVFGNGGDDIIRGVRDRDELHGQSGDDRVRGGRHDDIVLGGGGDDRLAGNRDDDIVRGRAGNDRLHGNQGNDRVHGGSGRDRCRGGTGKDRKHGCER